MKYFVIALCTILLTCELLVAHPVEDQVQNPSLENVRPERDTGHHDDAVDFGAHTGDNGAFGWYAHYPVQK
ncbi:uncharacterized protein LOC108909561 [Anoplophora glabripennis]|uniref:uncharacterized protein LOC108909561 n=1 Tax=Anoplophora glabripennis TaxID=217634 RepID=UPI0008748721|nr:uncharacterized protein LOC108909561 [Anoplophora glabripennis]